MPDSLQYPDYELPDPNEISCPAYLALFDAEDIDPVGKLEYYGDKPRVGGLPLYEFVKRYLALRGEQPRTIEDRARREVE